MRKPARAQALAQVRNGSRIAQKVVEAHGMRLAGEGVRFQVLERSFHPLAPGFRVETVTRASL